MALVTDWEKIEDGRLIKNYIDSTTSFFVQIRSRLDSLVALKTKYPTDTVELDGYITDVKNACQNIINTY